MEVPLGIIPGGGACVNLRRLLGAGRAMEAMGEGCADLAYFFKQMVRTKQKPLKTQQNAPKTRKHST